MNKIIAISGLAGDGKDSLCDMLRELFESKGFEFETLYSLYLPQGPLGERKLFFFTHTLSTPKLNTTAIRC